MILVADVLDQGAAKGHIENLQSAAQAENGKIVVDRCAHHGELNFVVLVHDAVQLLGRGSVAITTRIDVASTVEEHTVDPADEIDESAIEQLRHWRNHHRDASGALDSAVVTLS